MRLRTTTTCGSGLDALFVEANSAERLLSVIRALNVSGPSTISELQQQIGFSRQAIYRFMDVLLAHGYVVRLPDQPRYRLTPTIRELSDRVRDDDALEAVAAPIMVRLQRKVIWPTSFAIFEEGAMVIRHSTRSQSPFDFDNARVGDRLRLETTAVGLVYLALSQAAERRQALKLMRLSPAHLAAMPERLRQVRKSGYAVRVGGTPRNTSSIAVAVTDQGCSKAAVVVSFLTSAIALEEAKKLFVAPLRAAAAEIRRGLTSERQED
jgi:IclR family mhp operon transcriptional activator